MCAVVIQDWLAKMWEKVKNIQNHGEIGMQKFVRHPCFPGDLVGLVI